MIYTPPSIDYAGHILATLWEHKEAIFHIRTWLKLPMSRKLIAAKPWYYTDSTTCVEDYYHL